MQMGVLAGKAVVVTGSGRGIGATVVQRTELDIKNWK